MVAKRELGRQKEDNLLLVGLGVAIYLSVEEQFAARQVGQVRGLIGSEKEELFRDERVKAVLREKYGLDVHPEKAGSRPIATNWSN